jgi:hypothetical protein
MKTHGRKWRLEMRHWQYQSFGMRLYNYPLWDDECGYRKRMK